MKPELPPMYRFLLTAALALSLFDTHAASQAPVVAENGMVVTAQHLATHAGVDVLKAGGNAVDAAVAVGYTLAVVYPAAGNLGGGGFMTIQLADGRKTFLDFREKAPLAASANMFLDRDGNVVPGLSTQGHLAVGVPGTVSGMEYARARYGTMRRTPLLAEAIRYAQEGFVLEQGDIDMLMSATDAFKKDPATAAIFLNKGEPFKVGQKLVQKDLANTLRRIRSMGADGFYKGTVGAAIVASSWAGGGILMQADLDRYQTRELKPVECGYRGYGIVAAPPPSSGGVALCEMLNILEGYPLLELGFRSAQAVQYQIEAMRHAYVDRNSYLGDPDFVNNPVDTLLDKDYAAKIRALIAPDRAGDSRDMLEHFKIIQNSHVRSDASIDSEHRVHPFVVRYRTITDVSKPKISDEFTLRYLRANGVMNYVMLNNPVEAPHEGNNTTHYSIVDKWGNAVSVTYTLNDWFGAKITAAKTGVLLNNEMDDFTIKVGVPNSFGLVQGEANKIEPGKRPLSSMSPTIITKDGKPVMVLGTPGGSRIITTVLLTILNVIDYGMDLQQAVDAPRFHQQWLPDTTNVEHYALSPDTRKILESWGQKFGDPQPANQVAAILAGAPSLNGKPVGNNRYYGAIDPRRGTGLALGY